MSSIMISEYVARDISGIIMGLVNSMYPVTGIFVSLFFYFFKNWRLLFFVVSIPFSILAYWSIIYMVESVRWLNSQGKTEEIISTFDQIAKINKTEKEWEDYKPKMEQFLQKNTKKTGKGSNQVNLSIIQIIQLKSQQKKLLLLAIIWFLSAFYFYGIILNLEHLGGNMYVDSIMAFSAEMISEMSSGWMANIFGRLVIMKYGSYLGAIGFFLFTFIDFSIVIKSFLIFLTTFGYAAIFNVIYIYSPEVFPTPIRGSVCSYLFLLSRFGACFVAPISSVIGNYINYLFSICGVVTAVITYFLDESLGEPIIDEIPEFSGTASFISRNDSNEMTSIIDRGPVSSKYFVSEVSRKFT
jgi:MFS family permease